MFQVPTPKRSRGTSEPCALVTQEDATTALGATASVVNKQVSACAYHGPADESIGVTVVREITKAVFDADRIKSTGDDGFQDIPGVADGAFMASGSGGGQFECFKFSIAVQISLSLGGDGQVGDALRALGETACRRL